MSVVADASTIVKWFVEEDYSKDSLRLRDDHINLNIRVIAPTVARYEVLNALRYSGGFGTEELRRVSRVLEGYQLLEVPLRKEYAEETVATAMERGITIYDASYLSLGKLRKVAVYTADENLLKKVDDLDFVHHIKDYPRKRQSHSRSQPPIESTTRPHPHSRQTMQRHISRHLPGGRIKESRP